jgi:drug/metabolite transporter (DMT)-like permease
MTAAHRWPLLAVLGLLVNATVWGLSWIPFRELSGQGIHPLWATAILYSVSALVMSVAKRGALVEFLTHPSLYLIALASGLTNACFNTAVTIGDVVRVVLLFYLMPIWAIILGRWALNEAITGRALLRMALGLLGAMIVLYQPRLGLPLPDSVADWAALAGGFAFASNNILLRKLHRYSEASRAIAMFGGGMLMSATVALVLGLAGFVPWPASPSGSQALQWLPTLAFWSVLFLMANLGLQHGASRLPANVTAVIMLTEILVASLSAWWLGAAQIRPQDIVGGILIIATPWLIRDQAAVSVEK